MPANYAGIAGSFLAPAPGRDELELFPRTIYPYSRQGYIGFPV